MQTASTRYDDGSGRGAARTVARILLLGERVQQALSADAGTAALL